jgi:hypothetical protein
LCDYTHGGAIQVKGRNTKEEVTNNFDPKHICGVLQASAAIAYSAGIEIAKIANDAEMAEKLMNLHKNLYGEEK